MLAAGLALLAARWRVPEARIVGVMVAGIGLMGAVTNFQSDDPDHWIVAHALAALGTLSASGAAIALMARSPRRREAIVLGSFSLAAAALVSYFVPPAVYLERYEGMLAIGRLAFFLYGLGWAPYAFLTMAVAILWAREVRAAPPGDRAGNARAALALGVALFPAVVLGTFWTNLNFDISPPRPLVSLVPVLLLGAAVLAWAAAGRAAPRGAAAFAIGLPLAHAVLLPTMLSDVDLGSFGLARLVGLGVLAYAVLRLDALHAGFKATTISRGTSATVFLVVLLVVAQLAESFLSAQYGLLMGGVVAGTLLVAARPIERALEGRAGASSAPARADHTVQRIYRDAVRHALRDRRVTRVEELHLAELAREMRLDPADALRIRHEVEDEGRARP